MNEKENSHRIAFLGLVAWVSMCLLVSGWSNLDTSHIKTFSLAGLIGLISAVGLADSIQTRTKSNLAMLRAISTQDPLTGVGNRRMLDSEIDRRISQLKRHGATISLLMIDFDHFKRMNDTFGHLAGDAMLCSVASNLKNTLRDMDLLTRFGGEEFVAVLPGTDLSHARLAAERIRLAVEKSSLQFNGNILRVTVSIGVAEASKQDTPETLLRRVDAALYQAKQAGRNCCCCSSGDHQNSVPAIDLLHGETVLV